ncbi:MAG: YlxM family DNA-binding protein [Oscillospiraceae bacterium]
MKNQTFRMTMLFDFYGELLTERQKEFYELYYDEDLSLSEIAENYGISRQGVRDVIVRAEAYMTEIEDKTGLVRRFMQRTPTSSASRRRRTSCAGSMTAGMRIPASQSS